MYCLQSVVFVNFFLRSCKEGKKSVCAVWKTACRKYPQQDKQCSPPEKCKKHKIYSFLWLRHSKGQSNTLSGRRHLDLCACVRDEEDCPKSSHITFEVCTVSCHATPRLHCCSNTEKVVMWKQSKHSDAHQLSQQNTELKKKPQTFNAVVRLCLP